MPEAKGGAWCGGYWWWIIIIIVIVILLVPGIWVNEK